MSKEIAGFEDSALATAYADGLLYANDHDISNVEILPPLVGGGRLTPDDAERARGWRVRFSDRKGDDNLVRYIPNMMPH
jgi:hypothetical protein